MLPIVENSLLHWHYFIKPKFSHDLKKEGKLCSSCHYVKCPHPEAQLIVRFASRIKGNYSIPMSPLAVRKDFVFTDAYWMLTLCSLNWNKRGKLSIEKYGNNIYILCIYPSTRKKSCEKKRF